MGILLALPIRMVDRLGRKDFLWMGGDLAAVQQVNLKEAVTSHEEREVMIFSASVVFS